MTTSASDTIHGAQRASSSAFLDGLRRHMLLTDLAAVVLAVAGSHLARFGSSGLFDPLARDMRTELASSMTYVLVSVGLIAAWMVALEVSATRSPRILGAGDLELRRVVRASVVLFGLIAIVAYATRFDLARGYVALAFPTGLLLLLATRAGWRRWLRSQREQGRAATTTVLVGSVASVTRVAALLRRDPAAGFRVVGVYVPGHEHARARERGLEVLGTVEHALASVGGSGVDTVVVTGSDSMSADDVRRLSWTLTPGVQHLVMAPELTEVGGPRIHVHPVAGLPLVHVETPRFDGIQAIVKRVFDVLVAAAALAVLLVPLLVVAAVIRLTSAGPVLFRQQRVGRGGEEFSMLKLRSMVVDADARLATLLDREDRDGNAVLFKMHDDPRVTAVGRVIRRFSIDELPQLLNVLRGDMSIVGPRPSLAREVAQYEEHVHRRFLVKPGLTGLWQVSGRSNLSWEDSVRLDLYYVENWSLVGDLGIIARTARAVLARDGAY